MKTYYHTSEDQMIFDRTFAFIPFFIHLFVKAFIYFPLLLTGYIITRLFLPKSAQGYYWVGSIILVAVMLYCLLILLKGIIIALRCRGRKEWILLLGICVLYTCIPPGIMIYDFLRNRIHYVWLNWLLSIGGGFGVYTKYNFLLDLVPERVWFFYESGLRMGRHPIFNRQRK